LQFCDREVSFGKRVVVGVVVEKLEDDKRFRFGGREVDL
jgi:hypothetical protein